MSVIIVCEIDEKRTSNYLSKKYSRIFSSITALQAVHLAASLSVGRLQTGRHIVLNSPFAV